MGHPAGAVLSFEELYARIRALPEHLIGEILEPGVLRTMSRPGKRHRRAASHCARSLDAFDENFGGAGWWIEAEAEIRFPDGRLFVPDLCGFRVERAPELPEENSIAIVPDWCCEVLSPRTAGDVVAIKLPSYALFGVGWIWIVDPMNRLVEVFETVGGRATLAAIARDEDRAALPPFNGDIAVGAWWLPRAEE